MSGVICSMRRTLLSCTSLARNGLIALGITGPGAALTSTAARADEITLLQQIAGLFELNHQEFAVLTTALALLGFTVVAAILLMRTRVRATRIETRLRSDIQACQREPAASPPRRSACWRSAPGCRPSRHCRWTMPSTRCARRAKAFCST